ncbi:MAG: histidine kinase dimerization/phospho-acceptor domain-containing protein, partial [Bacilli bacterium]|nr:histidine kinase dimerization/phospho-acceptor domain-containing protein [Bacilli bacterium]
MTVPFGLGLDKNGVIITTIIPGAVVGNAVPVLIVLVGLISAFINRKTTNKKKVLPLKFIAVFGIIIEGASLMITNLSTALATLFMTSVSYLMFHTIENPDIKLITELEFAKDQAEKSNNAKSDFLSSMSHELRTPLNAIVGLTQLIKGEKDYNEIEKNADDILKASNNLLELVDSVLAINEIDSNNMEIVESNYNPIDIFNELVKVNTVRIGEKNIELSTRFSDKIPNTLYGDKSKIKNIINNLLNNAIKYTNEGIVEFTADCINKDDICNLRITVSDSGRGISEEQMDKLFTKFYRREEDK